MHYYVVVILCLPAGISRLTRVCGQVSCSVWHDRNIVVVLLFLFILILIYYFTFISQYIRSIVAAIDCESLHTICRKWTSSSTLAWQKIDQGWIPYSEWCHLEVEWNRIDIPRKKKKSHASLAQLRNHKAYTTMKYTAKERKRSEGYYYIKRGGHIYPNFGRVYLSIKENHWCT